VEVDGSAVLGTCTVSMSAQQYDGTGQGLSGDLISAPPQNITTTPTLYSFVISGFNLSPGYVVRLVVATSVQEAGGGGGEANSKCGVLFIT